MTCAHASLQRRAPMWRTALPCIMSVILLWIGTTDADPQDLHKLLHGDYVATGENTCLVALPPGFNPNLTPMDGRFSFSSSTQGISLQRHFRVLTKFAHVESRLSGRKRQKEVVFYTPVILCDRRSCSTSVAVGWILGSYTPHNGLKHLILNSFFPRMPRQPRPSGKAWENKLLRQI